MQAAPVANDQQTNGEIAADYSNGKQAQKSILTVPPPVGSRSPYVFVIGYDDEAFLSLAMSDSQHITQASTPQQQPHQQYGNNSINGKRSAPDSGFGYQPQQHQQQFGT